MAKVKLCTSDPSKRAQVGPLNGIVMNVGLKSNKVVDFFFTHAESSLNSLPNYDN